MLYFINLLLKSYSPDFAKQNLYWQTVPHTKGPIPQPLIWPHIIPRKVPGPSGKICLNLLTVCCCQVRTKNFLLFPNNINLPDFIYIYCFNIILYNLPVNTLKCNRTFRTFYIFLETSFLRSCLLNLLIYLIFFFP